MVNMKKIGAIATGALFIGATFGMASAAVTVPSGLSSKLASGGVAQADLVVGADAPGKVADTQAATEIQEAVAAKLVGTVGGDISIAFGSQDLHDNAHTNDSYGADYGEANPTQLGSGTDNDIYTLNANITLRYDGNADGDLKDDPEDYTLYNAFYVVDGGIGEIQLMYTPDMDSTYINTEGTTSTNISNAKAGEVVKIKGSKYVLTDNVTSDGDIELGPAILKTLSTTAKDPDKATVATGTLKMLFTGSKLALYDGKSLLNDPTITGRSYPYKLSTADKGGDDFGPYDIYVVNVTASGTAYISMTEKSQKFKISNNEEGVLGYSNAKIADADFTASKLGIYFQSDVIAMEKGGKVDIPDTYYQLKFGTDKAFDILREKNSAVISGATVKSATKPGSSFLKKTPATKIVLSVVGADIQIEFGSNDLHDDANVMDEFNLTALNTINENGLFDFNWSSDHPLTFNNNLRYDGNADGDLKDDPEDYTIYNRYYPLDVSAGDIQLAYRPISDTTYSLTGSGYIEDNNAGSVVKIRGSKYVVTEKDISDLDFELGPAITKTLSNTDIDPDSASVVTGTLKMLYNVSAPNGKLYLYDGNSLINSPIISNKTTYPHKLSSDDKGTDSYGPYDIYVIRKPDVIPTESIYISMVEKSQKFKVSNDEEGVLGYGSAKVGDTEWNTTQIHLLSDVINMVKGDTVDVTDTYYELKYTTAKKFDVLRKKTDTVSSGTKLKSTVQPGKAFLATGNSIVVTTTGGAGESVPDMKIKDESTADDTMNLVLIGGPVANTMTATLVENGKSRVDWYESEGDIEVVSSAFTSGKSAIIVAGKERAHTKDAAKALADSL